jgi:hypothetical protein
LAPVFQNITWFHPFQSFHRFQWFGGCKALDVAKFNQPVKVARRWLELEFERLKQLEQLERLERIQFEAR